MNNSKKSIKDILNVAVSNVINLIAGVLVGFLLPQVIDVPNYGYYKIFTLYASYVGLFGLGIIDGIYLKYGGISYDQLDKKEFRFYSRLIIGIQLCVSIIIFILSFIFLQGEYRFIFCAIGYYLLINNIIGYYQIVSQITCRFAELSKRNIIQSILTSGVVVILWVVSKNLTIRYRFYLILYLAIYTFLAIWYCKTYKEIIFGRTVKKVTIGSIKALMILGLPLLFANLCSSFILSLDRQFVSVLYDTSTYAIYSFAYNMLALVTTTTSAIAVVIYPNLKQRDERKLVVQYDKLSSMVLMLVCCCLLIYYPLCWFVNIVLPQYQEALVIFRVVFPGLAISSNITIVMHNYYKTLGINHLYFKKSIVILMVSFITNLIACQIWNTPIAISWASIFSLIIWYIMVEANLIKRYQVKYKKNLLYLGLAICLFYIVTYFDSYSFIGFILYGIGISLLTIVFNYKNIRLFLKKIKKKKEH